MMRSSLVRWLVTSRASRTVYAAAKIITFGYLILYRVLTQARYVLLAGWAETQSIRLDQSYAYADSPADQSVPHISSIPAAA